MSTNPDKAKHFRITFDAVEFPVDMLRVVAVAAKVRDSSISAIAAVRAERQADGKIITVATDGRRLMIASWPGELADSPASVSIPASTARQILQTALRSHGDDFTTVKISLSRPYTPAELNGGEPAGAIFCAEYDAKGGPASITWPDDEGQFPPYMDVVPDYRAIASTAPAIAINPTLIGPTLSIISAFTHVVDIHLPPAPNKPIRLDATNDLTKISVIGVIMPVLSERVNRRCGVVEAAETVTIKIEGGDLKTVSKAESDKGQSKVGGANAWRDVSIYALALSEFDLAKLVDANVLTLGQIADGNLRGVKGVGPEARRRISDACNAWHLANPHMSREPEPEAADAGDKPKAKAKKTEKDDQPPLEPGVVMDLKGDEKMVVLIDGSVVPESETVAPEFVGKRKTTLRLDDVVPGAKLLHVPTGGVYEVLELGSFVRSMIDGREFNLQWPDIYSGRFTLHTPAPARPDQDTPPTKDR